jgi:tetratricopeptide (TPR) repeat protein
MIAAALSLVTVLAVVAAKNPELASATDRARDMLRQGDHAAAEIALAQIAEQAEKEQDEVSAARALFFLALSKQQRAEAASGDEAMRLRHEALAHYARSLELYPKSGAVLNNIAEIEEALGNRERAKNALHDAIELNDSHRSGYAFVLGTLEEKDQNYKKAAQSYRLALESPNPPPGVEQKLIDASIASGKKSEELVGVLWELEKKPAGVETALDGALRALERGMGDDEERDALLGIVAAALARQNYTLSQLVDAGIAQRLSQLQDKKETSERVRALFGLYVSASSDRDQFLAWPQKLDDDDLPADLSPRRALGDLSVALARRALAEKEFDRAEPYLLLGADLGLFEDARVARDLATVYSQTRRPQQLRDLTSKFDMMLYGEQNALARNNLRDVYDYHVTAGSIYANSGALQEASMQLEKAIIAGERLASETASFEVEPAVRELYESVRARLRPRP